MPMRQRRRGRALLLLALAAVLGIMMKQSRGFGQLSSKSPMDVHGTWWHGCLWIMSGFPLLMSIDRFKERNCRELMEQLRGFGQLSSKSAVDVHGTWWRSCLRSMSGFPLLPSINPFKERTRREHEYGIVLQCDLYCWWRWSA